MKKKYVIELIEEVLNDATMENADFPQELKDKTKLWRDTWIISRLELALKEIKR